MSLFCRLAPVSCYRVLLTDDSPPSLLISSPSLLRNNNQPEDRIWGAGTNLLGNWTSKNGYRLGAYSIVSGIGVKRVCKDPTPYFEMGMLTHELGHMFGIPDQYDKDVDDETIVIGGVASFDVMANPYGWQRNPALPGYFGPYSRIVAGWLDPIVITRNGFYAIQVSSWSNLR